MNTKPHGELTIQTLAMPADTNPNGDIFGGWIVSQMDLAAGVLAKKIAQGRAATVAIHSMSFLKPVKVGDIISCYVALLNKAIHQ
jgi:acyl-CoA thioesterase YciA